MGDCDGKLALMSENFIHAHSSFLFVLFQFHPLAFQPPHSPEVFKYLQCNAIYVVTCSLLLPLSPFHTHTPAAVPRELDYKMSSCLSRDPVVRSYVTAASMRWDVVTRESVTVSLENRETLWLIAHGVTNTSAGTHAAINTCLCACAYSHRSQWKSTAGRKKGQMSDMCHLEWQAMTFTCLIIESCSV